MATQDSRIWLCLPALVVVEPEFGCALRRSKHRSACYHPLAIQSQPEIGDPPGASSTSSPGRFWRPRSR